MKNTIKDLQTYGLGSVAGERIEGHLAVMKKERDLEGQEQNPEKYQNKKRKMI